ncbi:hypothetical protein GCM10010965_01890 [Caldalkalibacillus thermarum]|nr:hypothetical protein [Caldalkalibacillus thermarum]GGK12536.1 hypothetical protein GCM10010965_01890 [Caldalkalibacillus thermarum]
MNSAEDALSYWNLTVEEASPQLLTGGRVRDIARETIRKMGKDIPVFASVDYYPVRKESHRTNTTIVEAYAADPSRHTLEKVNQRLREKGTTSSAVIKPRP